MNSCMNDYLNVIDSHLSSELVSFNSLTYIRTVAKVFPPCSIGGFECRLAKNNSRVDFFLWLPRHQIELSDSVLISQEWLALSNFYKQWTVPKSFLNVTIDYLGLELDLDNEPIRLPNPCILLALNKANTKNANVMNELMRKWVFQSFNLPFNAKLELTLRLCINSLPNQGRITHVGLMLSRINQGLRVVVKGLSSCELLDYLECIGWHGSLEKLAVLIDSIEKLVDSIALSFDLSDHIHPKIGIECHLSKNKESKQNWESLLNYLVAQKLCAEVKKESLLKWSGISCEKDNPQLWPANLKWADRLLRDQGISIFLRTIHEIKIVFQGDKIIESKAYLGFIHHWVN